MKFDKELFDPTVNHWKTSLDEKELTVLNEWVDFFEKRYPLMGYVEDSDKDRLGKNDWLIRDKKSFREKGLRLILIDN